MELQLLTVGAALGTVDAQPTKKKRRGVVDVMQRWLYTYMKRATIACSGPRRVVGIKMMRTTRTSRPRCWYGHGLGSTKLRPHGRRMWRQDECKI